MQQSHLPEPPEERATRRILEGFRDFSFKQPISRFPYLHCSVIRLSGKEFAHWVPTHTLYEPLMLVKLPEAFYTGISVQYEL